MLITMLLLQLAAGQPAPGWTRLPIPEECGDASYKWRHPAACAPTSIRTGSIGLDELKSRTETERRACGPIPDPGKRERCIADARSRVIRSNVTGCPTQPYGQPDACVIAYNRTHGGRH